MTATVARHTKSHPRRTTVRRRRVFFWVRRYLPAELVGTAALLAAAWIAAALGCNPVVTAYAAVAGEIVGFYGVLAVAVYREQRMLSFGGSKLGASVAMRRSLLLLVAEFGPAEMIDSLVVRPLMLLAAVLVVADNGWGLVVGKLAADVVFYIISAASFSLTVRSGLRSRAHHAARAHADSDTGRVVA